MAEIAPLRNGIQDRLALIPGLVAYAVATGQERSPAAIVFPKPPASGWHEMAAGGCPESHEFIVEIHVPLRIGLHKAQDTLDGYISPSGAASVAAAIGGDPTLGGAAQTSVVKAFTTYAFSKLNEVATLMAMIPVEVVAA